MALLVLLLCIGLQRFLRWHEYGGYQLNAFHYYYRWLMKQFAPITKSHGFFGVVILVLPALIIFSLIYILTYHWLTDSATFVLSLIVVWLSIDARDLRKVPYTSEDVADVFIMSYQRLFAPIFWFIVFLQLGIMPALIIYPLLVNLRDYLRVQGEEPDFSQLLLWTQWLLGILDWVPIRLLGLSFALLGHFAIVFAAWSRQLKLGIYIGYQLIVDWGFAAIGLTTESLQQHEQNLSKLEEAITLVDRSLILWLVMIAVFTLGIILG